MNPWRGMWGRDEVRISVSTAGKGDGVGWLGVWYVRLLGRMGEEEGLERVSRERGRKRLVAIFEWEYVVWLARLWNFRGCGRG